MTCRPRSPSLLRDLIRIDTSNPPGRRDAAPRCCSRTTSRRTASPASWSARDPDRANLIARIPGTGEGPSLALLGHTDVVPADAEDWQHPPFDGAPGRRRLHLGPRLGGHEERDREPGRDHGRARPLGVPAAAATCVFVAEADEEDGTEEVGMAWLVKARPDIAHRLRAQRGRRRAPGAGRRPRRRHGQHRREGHPRHAGHRAGRGRPRLDADVRRQRGAAAGDADHPAGEPPHAARICCPRPG